MSPYVTAEHARLHISELHREAADARRARRHAERSPVARLGLLAFRVGRGARDAGVARPQPSPAALEPRSV